MFRLLGLLLILSSVALAGCTADYSRRSPTQPVAQTAAAPPLAPAVE